MRSYAISIEQFTEDERRRWICPSCLGVCSCAACTRREIKRQLKGKSPSTGGNAGGGHEQNQSQLHANLTLNSVVSQNSNPQRQGKAAAQSQDAEDGKKAKKGERSGANGGAASQENADDQQESSKSRKLSPFSDDEDEEEEEDEDEDSQLYGSENEAASDNIMRMVAHNAGIPVVKPEAEDQRIRMSVAGAMNMNLNLTGNLGADSSSANDAQNSSARASSGAVLGVCEESDGSEHDNGEGPRKRANVLSMQQLPRVDHSPVYFSPSSHSASPISPTAPAAPLTQSASSSPSPPAFNNALALTLNHHGTHSDSPKQGVSLELQHALQSQTHASHILASCHPGTANSSTQDLGVSPATMFRSLTIVPSAGGSQTNSNTNSPIKPPLSLPNTCIVSSSSSSRNSSPTPGSPSQAYSRMKRPYSSDNSITAPSSSNARKASSSRAIPSSSAGLLSSASPAISEVQSVPLLPRSMDMSFSSSASSSANLTASLPSGVRIINSYMSDPVDNSVIVQDKPSTVNYSAAESLLRLTNDEHRPNKREKPADELDVDLSNGTVPPKVVDPFAQTFPNYAFPPTLGSSAIVVTPKLDAGNSLSATKSDSVPALFDGVVTVPMSMHTLTHRSTSLDHSTQLANAMDTTVHALTSNSMAVEQTAMAHQN